MISPGPGADRDGNVPRLFRLTGYHRHRLAEVILADSRRAGLGPGSRLPTERQLAASLGAPRTSVRACSHCLEAEGRISREVGRGTFLRDAGTGNAGTGRVTASQAPGDAAGAIRGWPARASRPRT